MTNLATTSAVDITLTCSDGIQLAGQVWKVTTGSPTSIAHNNHDIPTTQANIHRRILCLHGWMDNCRSFHYFAPNLLRHLHTPMSPLPTADVLNGTTTTTTEIVALDLPGHGWSSHRSLDCPPIVLPEAIYYVAEAIHQLQWCTPTPTKQSTTVVNDEPQEPSTPSTFTLVGHSMGAAISCLYAAAFPEQIQHLVLLEGGMLFYFLLFVRFHSFIYTYRCIYNFRHQSIVDVRF
jgi:pimeloyl-ACP methyl ester carboxylesterase